MTGMPSNYVGQPALTPQAWDAFVQMQNQQRNAYMTANPDWGKTVVAPNHVAPFRSGGGMSGFNRSPTSGGTAPTGRNPVVQEAINSTFGFAAGTVNGPRTISQTIVNPGQAQATAGLRNTYASTQPARDKSLTDFTREFFAGAEERKRTVDQESGSIDNVYSGGLLAKLDELRKKRRGAVNVASNKAINRARLDNNISRMGYGGAGSSYLDRAYGGTVANILAQEAVSEADLAREDEMYAQGQKTNLLGARQRLQRDYLTDSLMPHTETNRAVQMDASTLAALANLENQNSIYETPEDILARRMGTIGSMEALAPRVTSPSGPSLRYQPFARRGQPMTGRDRLLSAEFRR